MDIVHEIGIQIVLFFQGLGTWLIMPMKLLSFLGKEEFFLLLAPALYWCIDSQAGLRVGLLLMISGSVNSFFKLLFFRPRPYWVDPAVKAYGTETSFGIPSGHAQNSTAVWGGLAVSLKKKWLWVTAIVLIVLIGLSRIYNGVHFPTDVLVGWLIGTTVLAVYLKLEPRVKHWTDPFPPFQKAALAFAFSLILILLGLVVRVSLANWELPAEWVANAQAATPDAEPINPTDISGLVSNSAVLFGLCLGAIYIARYGGFKAQGKGIQLVLRYLIGTAGILILWACLRVIFPGGEDVLSQVLRYLRYGLVGFWVSGGAPWVFKKLKLAD
jgi:membrane-associated phospholipid phosphatase